jgi:hypothetical protein
MPSLNCSVSITIWNGFKLVPEQVRGELLRASPPRQPFVCRSGRLEVHVVNAVCGQRVARFRVGDRDLGAWDNGASKISHGSHYAGSPLAVRCYAQQCAAKH